MEKKSFKGLITKIIIIFVLGILTTMYFFSMDKDTKKDKTSEIEYSRVCEFRNDVALASNRTMYVTASALNVRSGAGVKYKKVGLLKKNNSVTVTGTTKNGWSKIKFKGKTAYVSSKYLTTKKAQKKTVKPLEVPKGLKIICQKGVTTEQKNKLITKFKKLPKNIKEEFIEDKWEINMIKGSLYSYNRDFGKTAIARIEYNNKKMFFSMKDNAIEEAFFHEFGHFIDSMRIRWFFDFMSSRNPFTKAMKKEVKHISYKPAKKDSREFFAEVYHISMERPKEAKKYYPKTLKLIQQRIKDHK